MKTLHFFIICLFLPNAYAQNYHNNVNLDLNVALQKNTIYVAMPMLISNPDARTGGLGNAGIGLYNGSNSIYKNTGQLAFSDDNAVFSLGYSPYFNQIIPRTNYFYFSGFTKIGSNNKHTIGGSIKNLHIHGNTIYDNAGIQIDEFSIDEFEFLGAYTYRFSERSSIGLNAKILYSGMSKLLTLSRETAPLLGGAFDISYAYQNKSLKLMNRSAEWGWGLSLTNMGSKMNYNNMSNTNFLPANIGIGSSFKLIINEKNTLTLLVDANRLMVPRGFDFANGGFATSTNVGSVAGMLLSFHDSKDGVSGELKEFNLGGGIEYEFANLFFLRGGYFHEFAHLGNRRMLSFGAGVKLKSFQLNTSFVSSTTQNNIESGNWVVSVQYSFK